MAILGKLFSFGCHKTGRFWEIYVFLLVQKWLLSEIFVLRLAKNGLSREIFVLRLAQKWPFSRNSSPLAGIKMVVSGKFLFSCWQKMAIPGKFLSFGWHKTDRPGEQIRKIRDFFGGRNGFFQAFLSVPWKKCPWLRISFTVFRLFLLVGNGSSTCFFLCAAAIPLCVHASSCLSAHARMCAYTRPREIHNVGLFPSVFPSFKKYPYTISSYSVIYKKTFKISSKKYCVKVAEPEKVRTFATAFERESRWEWQNGKERQTFKGAAPEYLTLQDGKGARNG